MKVRQETILIAALVLILVLVTGGAALFQARQQTPQPLLSGSSSAPEGAMALRLWLSAAGYQVDDQPSESFDIPSDTAAVLILQPSVSISLSEWKILDVWVRQGGTLLLAANRWDIAFSGNPFKLDASKMVINEYDLFPPAPIFQAPPLSHPAHLVPDCILNYAGNDGLALLSIPQGTVAWQIHLGKGQLLAVTDARFLSNDGLKNTGNADLALNLLSQIPPASQVLLDEWHHGEKINNEAGYGFTAWLTQTPAGFAVLFSTSCIFLGLVLAGRSFGRRVPPPKTQIRRGTLEYVNAVANLNRRAGHREAVMKNYYTELKRAYGKRYRISLDQPDSSFVDQVLLVNPALDRNEFINLLTRLSQPNFSETEMVQLARECAEMVEKVQNLNK